MSVATFGLPLHGAVMRDFHLAFDVIAAIGMSIVFNVPVDTVFAGILSAVS